MSSAPQRQEREAGVLRGSAPRLVPPSPPSAEPDRTNGTKKKTARVQEHEEHGGETNFRGGKRRPPKDSDEVMDNIACYNIENKYCHTIAMQLMAEGDMTYMALQEPYAVRAAGSGSNAAWRVFEEAELDALRYSSVSSKWQVIIYDNVKWGGREAENLEVHLDGRVVTAAFTLTPRQKIGMISVYVPVGCNGSADKKEERDEEAREVSELVRAKLEGWRRE